MGCPIRLGGPRDWGAPIRLGGPRDWGARLGGHTSWEVRDWEAAHLLCCLPFLLIEEGCRLPVCPRFSCNLPPDLLLLVRVIGCEPGSQQTLFCRLLGYGGLDELPVLARQALQCLLAVVELDLVHLLLLEEVGDGSIPPSCVRFLSLMSGVRRASPFAALRLTRPPLLPLPPPSSTLVGNG